MSKSNPFKWQRCLAAVCVFILLAACAAAPNRPQQVPVSTKPSESVENPRAQLVYASSRGAEIVTMDNVLFGTVGKFTRVQLDIRNLSGERLDLEYKIDWQDEAGFSVNSMSAWQRFSLDIGQIETVRSVGKIAEAYRIRITVRELQAAIELIEPINNDSQQQE